MKHGLGLLYIEAVDAGQQATMDLQAATYRKVTWHLIPFLFACYILEYVDRVNVGFAKLRMQTDLGMSDTVYGIGAGLFFVGYFLLEVPANMMLRRVGARRWLGPIMIAWGLVSAATLFVEGARSFYALRLLLGVVESGFFRVSCCTSHSGIRGIVGPKWLPCSSAPTHYRALLPDRSPARSWRGRRDWRVCVRGNCCFWWKDCLPCWPELPRCCTSWTALGRPVG
jgi:Major Facilitator Superfamily